MAEITLRETKALEEIRRNPVLRSLAAVARKKKMRLFLVGGALRDMFLKKNGFSRFAELDLASAGNAPALAKTAAEALGAACVVLDRARRTARIVSKHGLSRYECDLSELRAPDLRGDLQRRDFTINTLCCDAVRLVSGHDCVLYDYFHGLRDIRRKIVRMTSPLSFQSDPLRILRGFGFCAQYGFTLEKKTRRRMKTDAFRLRAVSGERVRDELAGILQSGNAASQLRAMDKAGVWPALFPELSDLRGMFQGGYHHLDAWRHSLETAAQAEKLLRRRAAGLDEKCRKKLEAYLRRPVCGRRTRLWLLELACLLHDCGKPLTKTTGADKRLHFYTHEKAGADISGRIARRLRLSVRECKLLSILVRGHLRPGQLVNRRPAKRAVFRFFRGAGENAPLLLLLALADRRAMRGPLSRRKSFVFYEDEIFNLLAEFFKERNAAAKKSRLLDGHDLMKLLRIPPGPPVGTLLARIEEAQALGLIRRRSQAQRLAVTLYKKIKDAAKQKKQSSAAVCAVKPRGV